MIEIIQAQTVTEIGAVRDLFVEYAQSLGFSLCFESFDKEITHLPGVYSPPRGRLLLAQVNGEPAGCAGLRPFADDICEIKRLYVRPEFRGSGLGREITERVIEEARKIGYSRMRLDTVSDRMQTAIELYRHIGFKEIAPYREMPVPTVIYMELDLTKHGSAAGAHPNRG
jgi:putative acetyltransferase